MEKFRCVLAGCGRISGNWIPVVRDLECAELVGLVDLNPDAARACAEKHGLDGIACASDLGTFLENYGADVVLDCTIPTAHRDVVMTAVSAGCHVMGEKPLAETMADARDMVRAAETAGVIYGVMQNRRWDANIRRVRAALDAGGIGTPHTFHTDFFLGPHFGGFREEMEHVLLLDMAIHSFDAIRFLTDANPVSVWASDWNPPGSWYSHGASAVAFFELEHEVRSSYRGSWCSEGLPGSWQCVWRIIGTQGTLLWDGDSDIRLERVTGTEGFIRGVENVVPPEPEPGPTGHEAAILDFFTALREHRSPATPAADNIKSLAMVHGAIESAETRTVQMLKPLLA